MIDDGDAIAQFLGFLEIVRGQQDRGADGVQLTHVLPQVLTKAHVHACGGLVEHDDRRRMHEGLADQEAPSHPARQRAGIGVGFVGEADDVQDLVRAAFILGHAVKTRLHFQEFARGEERVEVQFLRHDPDGEARMALVRVDVVIPDLHRAGTTWPRARP